MARSPRTRVPKTSGQGVSRLSYQKSYDLGNRATGGLADFRTDTQDTPKRRSYGKGQRGDGGSVSFGATWRPLAELLEDNGKPAKPGVKLGRTRRKELK